MQGEVYVPYTPIGGSNMSRMAEPRISGSSQDIAGGSPQEHIVRWVLPGGIVGVDWHNILGSDTGNTDEDVQAYVQSKVGEDQIAQTSFINQRLYDHVHTILTNAGQPGYSWDQFNLKYRPHGCIVDA